MIFMTWHPLVGQYLFIVKASQLLSDTWHLVGFLCTSDQPNSETPTWQHKTHKRQTSMPLAGFEPTIPSGEWLQTYALDPEATRVSN